MCCVVIEFVYANTIINFNLAEKCLLEYSATIHLNFSNRFCFCWIMFKIASSAGNSEQEFYPEIGLGMLSDGNRTNLGK